MYPVEKITNFEYYFRIQIKPTPSAVICLAKQFCCNEINNTLYVDQTLPMPYSSSDEQFAKLRLDESKESTPA